MKNNKVVKIIIIIVAVAIVLVGGYFFVNEKIQISKINEEIKKINTTAIIDEEIKATGKYAEVEKGVKDYLKEYQETIKSLYSLYEADEYKNMLAITNYEADGPEFTKSLETLKNIQVTQDVTKNKVSEMIKAESIEKKADELGLQGKYKKTFIEIIKIQDEANIIIAGIEKDQQIVNKVEEIVNLLKNNPAEWEIKQSQLEIYSEDILNQYNTLTTELTKLAASTN